MNFNVIDKKTINLKTVKKNVTKILGHHYTTWASGPVGQWAKAGPHFRHCNG
jgi:hypothetical protein